MPKPKEEIAEEEPKNKTIRDIYAEKIRLNQRSLNRPATTADWSVDRWKSLMRSTVQLQMLMNDEPEVESEAIEKLSLIDKQLKVERDIFSKGGKLLQNELFMAMTAEISGDAIKETCKRPEILSARIVKEMKYLSTLTQDPKSDASIYSVTKHSIKTLKATGYGKDALGRERTENSKEYDDMLKAARKMQSKSLDDANPDNIMEGSIYRARRFAQKYIQTHLKPRWTTTGKTRFQEAMKLVAQTMPPKEFRDYVADLNRQRGTEKKGGRHHLDPDQFLQRTPARIIQDAQNKLNVNKQDISITDAAKVAAAYELGKDQDGKFTQPITEAALKKKTLEIAGSIEFNTWFNNRESDVIKNMIQNAPDKISQYQQALNPKNAEVNSSTKKTEPKKADAVLGMGGP